MQTSGQLAGDGSRLPFPKGKADRRAQVRQAHAAFLCLGLLIAAATAGAEGTPAPTPDPAWLSRLQAGLAAREYWATANREGLQAPNRAHRLRTRFETTGIRVHDRVAAGSPGLVELRVAGLGRGVSLAPVAPGEVTSREARVEIRREALVEWYENGPAGLEQGFTLQARPPGEGPLVVELSVALAEARLRGEATQICGSWTPRVAPWLRTSRCLSPTACGSWWRMRARHIPCGSTRC